MNINDSEVELLSIILRFLILMFSCQECLLLLQQIIRGLSIFIFNQNMKTKDFLLTFPIQIMSWVLIFCILLWQCGGIFYDEFGEIQSPNYPKRWKEDSIDCVWTIQAAKGKNVRITFLDFSLEDFFGECSLEKLSVHDGAHITSPALGKLLCGDSNPPTITSNDNALTLYLTSQDGANYGSGFKLQWNIVPGMHDFLNSPLMIFYMYFQAGTNVFPISIPILK